MELTLHVFLLEPRRCPLVNSFRELASSGAGIRNFRLNCRNKLRGFLAGLYAEILPEPRQDDTANAFFAAAEFRRQQHTARFQNPCCPPPVLRPGIRASGAKMPSATQEVFPGGWPSAVEHLQIRDGFRRMRPGMTLGLEKTQSKRGTKLWLTFSRFAATMAIRTST